MSLKELARFIRSENERSSSVQGFREIITINEEYVRSSRHGFVDVYVINSYDKRYTSEDGLNLIVNYNEVVQQVEKLVNHLPPKIPSFIHISKIFGQHVVTILEAHVSQLFNHVFFIY